ncbi:MAG: ABC transporter permease subunit [Patescibacteria group bacterium]
MFDLIKVTLRQRRIALIAYSLGGLAMIWLYVSIYPSMQAQIGDYTKLIESMPKGLMKAFGADAVTNNFEGLIGTKLFGFVWPLIMLFLTVSFSCSAIAGEIEKTSMGLWLSAPISRLKIYWSKYIAVGLALTVFMVLTVLAVLPMAGLYNIDVSSKHIMLLSIVAGLFALAVTGLTFLASSLFSEKSRVYAVVGAGLLVMYAINLLASLSDKFVNLKYASFFYYYNSNDLLSGRPINRASLLVFGTAAVLGALGGAIVFRRRDISI